MNIECFFQKFNSEEEIVSYLSVHCDVFGFLNFIYMV